MLPALSLISFLGFLETVTSVLGSSICVLMVVVWISVLSSLLRIVFCPSPLASWSRTSISKQLSFSRLNSETSWYPTVYSSSISCYSLFRRWHLCEQRKSQLYSKWQTYVIFSFKNAKYSFGPRYIDHNMFRRMFCFIFLKAF